MIFQITSQRSGVSYEWPCFSCVPEAFTWKPFMLHQNSVFVQSAKVPASLANAVLSAQRQIATRNLAAS
jgi:hypothetical protein